MLVKILIWLDELEMNLKGMDRIYAKVKYNKPTELVSVVNEALKEASEVSKTWVN